MKNVFEEYYGCNCPKCKSKLHGNIIINKYHCEKCNKDYRRVYHSPLLPILYTILSTVEKFIRTRTFDVKQMLLLLIVGIVICVFIEQVIILITRNRPYNEIFDDEKIEK